MIMAEGGRDGKQLKKAIIDGTWKFTGLARAAGMMPGICYPLGMCSGQRHRHRLNE
jgi:hypothetical protein